MIDKGKPMVMSTSPVIQKLCLYITDIEMTFPDADFQWFEYVETELFELDMDPVVGVMIVDAEDNQLVFTEDCEIIDIESSGCSNYYSIQAADYEPKIVFLLDLIKTFMRHDLVITPADRLRNLLT
jgi:hypothetical protein